MASSFSERAIRRHKRATGNFIQEIHEGRSARKLEKGDRDSYIQERKENRPVSLTSVISKIMESIIRDAIVTHLVDIIGNSIFHLSLELLTKFWKMSPKVA